MMIRMIVLTALAAGLTVVAAGRGRGGIARIVERQTNSRSNGGRQTGLWDGFEAA